MRIRGLLVTFGRGAAARVTAGFGNHGIHGLRADDVVRARGDDVLELPALPFLTVITTSLPSWSALTSIHVLPLHSASLIGVKRRKEITRITSRLMARCWQRESIFLFVMGIWWKREVVNYLELCCRCKRFKDSLTVFPSLVRHNGGIELSKIDP